MNECSCLGKISARLSLSLSVRFLGKCSDFFYWFVNSHLKRVEFNPNFPVLEFLSLFYKYTFKQVSTYIPSLPVAVFSSIFTLFVLAILEKNFMHEKDFTWCVPSACTCENDNWTNKKLY